MLATAASCLAQNELIIRGAAPPNWQAEAQRIYESACAAVESEFRNTRPVRPRITLVLGAHENIAQRDSNQIRLADWDPDLFAQGVVVLVFDAELDERRMAVSKRALVGAASVVDAKTLAKDHR